MSGGPPPRGVLFDYGGVISNMRWDVCRGLEERHGLPERSLFTTLWRCEAWRDVERGHGDREAWIAEAHASLCRLAGRELPRLHEAWRAAQGPIAENVEVVRALRGAYRVGVLSNADLTLRDRMRRFGLLDLFDEVVCSAEVGLAKPEPEIYTLACARLGVAPAECVFIDDHESNVGAAEKVGLRGIHYRLDRGDDLRAQLAAVGVATRR